jgi:hypothetical protein
MLSLSLSLPLWLSSPKGICCCPCLSGCRPRMGSAIVPASPVSSPNGICYCPCPFWLSSPKGICCCPCPSGCHPRRGPTVVLAPLAVIPEGDLLLSLFSRCLFFVSREICCHCCSSTNSKHRHLERSRSQFHRERRSGAPRIRFVLRGNSQPAYTTAPKPVKPRNHINN